ncbi:hemolysin, partial [Vibrio fluvialis]|nr:hemolysin [Vibrio fluvialis]MCE7619686.1 hemolysin [Vibrio fluvialis]MCE7627048.1 hemolysin [Vibrio fluvialis]
MIVIDTNGNIRTATIGEKLPHGTVIVQRGDNITDDAELKAQLVDANNTPQDITDDVARIFAALEEGQDPTQVDDAEAPAAGGAQGSALAEAATIERIGSETIATTDFDTTGFESLGLSQTQSLALSSLLVVSTGSTTTTTAEDVTISINAVTGDNQVDDSEDNSVTLSGTTSGSESGQTVSVSVLDASGTEVYNGTAMVQADGSWSISGVDMSEWVDEASYTVKADVSNATAQATRDFTIEDTTATAAPTV